MAGQRRHSYRRRRGRVNFLNKLLFILPVALIVFAITLFFRIEKFTVNGNEIYTKEKIVEASGIENGRNLFLMNKYAAAQDIFQTLPYVEEVSIHRALPDTIVIDIQECKGDAAVRTKDGKWWLFSAGGRVLEACKTQPNCILIKGVTAEKPKACETLSFGEKDAGKCEALIGFLSEARDRGIIAGINAVDVSSNSVVSFTYLNRFTVRIPWTADFSYKIKTLSAVTDSLEANEVGVIDLTSDGKASFIPA